MDNMLCFFTHTTLDFIPILLFVVDSQRTSSPHRGTGPQSVDEIYLSMAPYARVNSKSNHRAPPPSPHWAHWVAMPQVRPCRNGGGVHPPSPGQRGCYFS